MHKRSRTKYFLILLLFIHLAGVFRILVPIVSYNLNYDYISSVLCINKENKEMQCNGKCYLKKELKKTAEEESDKEKGNSVEVAPCIIDAQSEFINVPEIAFENHSFYEYSEEEIFSYLEKYYPPPQG